MNIVEPPVVCPPNPENKDLVGAGVVDGSAGFAVPNNPPDPKDKPLAGLAVWLLAGGGPAGVVELAKLKVGFAGVVAPDGVVLVFVLKVGILNPPVLAGALFSLLGAAVAPVSFFCPNADPNGLDVAPPPNRFDVPAAGVALWFPNIDGAVPVLFPNILGVVAPEPGLELFVPNGAGLLPPNRPPPAGAGVVEPNIPELAGLDVPA